METCFESKLNRVMPNGTLRGVRGRGNYSIFLPTRFLLSVLLIFSNIIKDNVIDYDFEVVI